MAIPGWMTASAYCQSFAHRSVANSRQNYSKLADRKHGSVPESIGLVKILKGKPSFQALPTPCYILENGLIQYGETSVSAQRITLWPGPPDDNGSNPRVFQGKGEAIGNVEVVGPSFSLKCLRYTFDWSTKTGHALMPEIIIPNLRITADQGVFSENTFTFDQAIVSQTGALKGLGVRAKKLTIRPNEFVRAVHGNIFSGNKDSFGFARYQINLTQDQGGFHLPYPSYSSQYGFGLTFNSMIHLGPTTNFNLSTASVQKALPFYNLQTNFFDRGDSPKNFHQMETVFDERFSQSFFDDIESRDPSDRYDADSAFRRRASIGTFWNEEPNDRITTDSYFSPIQVGYEVSQRIGGLGIRADFIGQDVGFAGHQANDRGVLLQSASFKPLNLNDHLTLIQELNAGEYYGSTNYMWVRAMSGLSWSVANNLNLAGAIYASSISGSPQFPMDEPYSRSGISLRMDTHLRAQTFSVLTKYDFGSTRWYDTEFYFSQVAGLYEPYVVYRTFPSALKFGIKLRFNAILDGVFGGAAKSAPVPTSYKL